MSEVSLSSRQFAILVAILLLGLGLRLAPWGQNRFLEDEALYAYWGLQIATGTDLMLDEEPVDKPPLYPYTQALSFLLASPWQSEGVEGWRASERAARLPSLLASLAGIAIVYALGQALYGDERVGLVAALLLALSPFDILFASTAFTDPLMTAFVLGALLAAARDHLGMAGLLAGLAVATKQQGLLFLPLVVTVGVLPTKDSQKASLGPRPDQAHADSLRAGRILAGLRQIWSQRWLRFSLGFGLVVAGTLGWDAARLQRPGFLEQSLISYGGLGPAQPADLGERSVQWLQLAGAFWVSPWFNTLLLGGLAAWALGGVAGWWTGWTRLDLAMGIFIVAFLLLHWLVGFQVWDRYLLGLVPLVALLAARAFVTLGMAIQATPWRRFYVITLGVILVVLLTAPVLQASRSGLPIGGDHGAYDGIDRIANYMLTQAPVGSVLYHHWLGYHYRFYLYSAPLRLHWYPDFEDLARDAHVYRREPRYIAFPSWRDSSAVKDALNSASIKLEQVYETKRRDGSFSFRLYRLEGP